MVILTTNRRESLDTGLIRRIGVKVAFPRPGEEERWFIWRSLLPPRAPLAAEVAPRARAGRFPLAGGDIKNAVLGAVRRAASRGRAAGEITAPDPTAATDLNAATDVIAAADLIAARPAEAGLPAGRGRAYEIT